MFETPLSQFELLLREEKPARRGYSFEHLLAEQFKSEGFEVLPNSNLTHRLWVPIYSPSAPKRLVEFVDWLGGRYATYLEGLEGPFEERITTENRDLLGLARVVHDRRRKS